MRYYGVYEKRSGPEYLLAVGQSVNDLRDRYNNFAIDRRYQGEIPEEETSVSFPGSTGGGCDPFMCTVTIREIEERF